MDGMIITTDKETIGAVTGILNRANCKRVRYEFADFPSYEMKLIYKDLSEDILTVFPHFAGKETLLYGNNGNAYFINEKQRKKDVKAFIKGRQGLEYGAARRVSEALKTTCNHNRRFLMLGQAL
ncbi:hypothetical protein [Bacillus sp. 1P06AnD]|uniref:hypothetical protein n=1 Tax=Bacillus sp. 1P06AnD TaxID=3132208 RepID=UPI0039A31666